MEVNRTELISRICRLCLRTPAAMPFVSLYEPWQSIDLNAMLFSLTWTKAEPSDELPQSICEVCLAKLQASFLFKLMIQRNNTLLTRHILPKKCVPEKSEFGENPLTCPVVCHLCPEEVETVDLLDRHVAAIHIEHVRASCGTCMIAFGTETPTGENESHNCLEITMDCLADEPKINDDISSGTPAESIPPARRPLNFPRMLAKIPEYTRSGNDMEFLVKICDCALKCRTELKTHLLNHKNVNSFTDAHLSSDLDIFEGVEVPSSDRQCLIDFIVGDITSSVKIPHRYWSVNNKNGCEFDLDGTANKKSMSCIKCVDRFKDVAHCLAHFQLKHVADISQFPQCPDCTRHFPNPDLLERHATNDCRNTEKRLKCTECGSKFMWKTNLYKHQLAFHSETEVEDTSSRRYQCKICQKGFKTRNALNRHIQTHSVSEQKFKCAFCAKSFNRKDNLKVHIRYNHEGKDPEKSDAFKNLCVYCGHSFRTSSNLIVHLRRHTGEKPYGCDLCDMKFPRSSDMTAHRVTHTGEKPHLCTVCGKGFSRSNKLTRHMRIHTGARPYKCTYCEKAFTQSNDLTLHIRRHTGDKPFVCGICGERFYQGSTLLNHRRMQGHYEDGQSTTFPDEKGSVKSRAVTNVEQGQTRSFADICLIDSL